jgi:hypothetical protein
VAVKTDTAPVKERFLLEAQSGKTFQSNIKQKLLGGVFVLVKVNINGFAIMQ